jgi:hypothetical protein
MHEDLPLSAANSAGKRTLLLVIWCLDWPTFALPTGRYRMCPDGDGHVQASAYLIRGNAQSKVEALDGRVVLTTLACQRAMGAFDVTFPTVRFHGTFLATRRRVPRENRAGNP